MNPILVGSAIVISIVAIIEAIWSPRFEWVEEDEQLWLFYNHRKKADRRIHRKGVQVL